MSGHLSENARSLEEAFFAKENARLLEKLRERNAVKERRQAMRDVVQIDDEELVDHLLELGLCPETLLALTLIPLTAVAWADGDIHVKEREAIMKAAEEKGVAPGTPGHALLDDWLQHKPAPELIEAWKRHARALWDALNEKEREEVQERFVGQTREVAAAAGGFLGLKSAISPAEQAVLDELEAVFR